MIQNALLLVVGLLERCHVKSVRVSLDCCVDICLLMLRETAEDELGKPVPGKSFKPVTFRYRPEVLSLQRSCSVLDTVNRLTQISWTKRNLIEC